LISQLLPPTVHTRSLRDAAREAGVDPTLAERIWSSLGFARFFGDRLTEGDMELVRTLAGVQSAGLPLIALLQMARVYGQSLEQLADAEVRLFRLYVHEPLMAGNVHADEIAEHMHGMAQELLPVAAPVMEYVHQRFVQHFIDRELLGGLGAPGGEAGLDIGRVQVVIAFADVVGYTRLTEERGVHAALAVVERLTHTVEHTLPPDARVVKTIGDEVMIVGNDPIALTEWALAFQLMNPGPPQVRMGMHSGHALYRDGDYYGREVNLAARVVAHAQPGDVLVTRPIVDAAQDRMTFETAGRAALKGFAKSIELFRAGPPAA
jgi:adenylate cyclase